MVLACHIFAGILLFIAVVLLVHHGYHHNFDPETSAAQKESCPQVCYFQIKDVSNHETWILVCVTNALSIAVLSPMLMSSR